MITGIKKEQHGILDYTYVPFTLTAAELLGFTDEKEAAITCRSLGLAVLGYTLLTDARWGAVKWIPYKTHAALDVASGVAALTAAAVIPTVNRKAHNTLLALGVTGLVVGALSIIGAKHS